MIEDLKKDPEVWVDTHTLLRNNAVLGVLLIVVYKITRWEHKYEIVKEESTLLLKYLHIMYKGKGY